MIKAAILSFSDGRGRVHESLEPYILACEQRIKNELEKTGEVIVETVDEVIFDSRKARELSLKLAAGNPDAVILNIPVFAFPNFSLIAASFQHVPLLAIAPVNGKLPGLGGLQAAVNLIRQMGMKCEKVWGNIEDEHTLRKVMEFLRAAHAVTTLKGQIYGLFGGRSIGMGTGAVNPDLWFKVFGVDVEHIDQLEIIRRAESVDQTEVDRAFDWLVKKTGSINYDKDKLTIDSLKWQIRCYYATKDLVCDRKLDFIGVKCHYELSEYYYTQCLSAALFNDPYDWDGPKEPVVYSCEADSDGALTMQILKLVSGKPVIFFDLRHYDDKEGVFAFCNCGSMPTWYAARSDEPGENLKEVALQPIIPKYAGKGCHVQYVAKEGEMTFGRLTRVLDKYKFTIFKGEFKKMPNEKLEETCPVWPHGYTKVNMDPLELINRFENNHVHAVHGDYIEEIRKFCKLKEIECEIIE